MEVLAVLDTDGLLFIGPVFSEVGMLIVGIMNGPAVIWDITGKRLATIGHNVKEITLSLTGTRAGVVATTDDTGVVQFWGGPDFHLLCQIGIFGNRHWTAVSPLGYFDTDSAEDAATLHWVFSDEPFRPLPLDIFRRDYFVPGLIGRVLLPGNGPGIPVEGAAGARSTNSIAHREA